MSYFNYHAKAKNLIATGHLVRFEIVPKWGNISPALVLYFDNNRPMPIREYRWEEYSEIPSSVDKNLHVWYNVEKLHWEDLRYGK